MDEECGEAVALAYDAEEEVFGLDGGMEEASGFALCVCEDASCFVAEWKGE